MTAPQERKITEKCADASERMPKWKINNGHDCGCSVVVHHWFRREPLNTVSIVSN